LRECPIIRIFGKTVIEQRLQLAVLEVTRLPVIAFIGLHRRNVEFVVNDASERVTEERQRRRFGLFLISRDEQPRIPGGQYSGERVLPRERALGRQCATARQNHLDRALRRGN